MENKLMIRSLKPEEIECRVGVIKENGLSLLLYKDARVDQRILDETVGAFNWKREHISIGGSVYCSVSIRDPETNEWVSKQDVGSSNRQMETETSLASDSFKRACFNWGIGRELYSSPFIWIPADRVSIIHNNGKFCCNEHFIVADIGLTEQKEIKTLVIEKLDGTRVFTWQRKIRNQSMASGSSVQPDKKPSAQVKKGISQKQRSDLKKELKRTGVSMKAIDERFHVSDPDEMSQDVYQQLMKALAQTRTSNAA